MNSLITANQGQWGSRRRSYKTGNQMATFNKLIRVLD